MAFVGWNTDSNATVGLTNLTMCNSNVTLYAIYKKEAITYTVTYTRGSNVSEIDSTGDSCTIKAVYNNAIQATSCTVTSPSINASTGYSPDGWYSNDTKVGAPDDSYTLTSNVTLTAIAEMTGVTWSNSHIKEVYKYIEDDNSSGTGANYTGCLGGEETGCKKVPSSWEVGTIVKYEVKSGVEKYFNEIKDNGTTLTMQQRENTLDSKAWYGTEGSGNFENTYGPATTSGYALYELEQATSSWYYVNTINYSIGDENTTLGYSGCYSPSVCRAKYNLSRRGKKARMLTVHEAASLNCTEDTKSCMKFLNNYMCESIKCCCEQVKI